MNLGDGPNEMGDNLPVVKLGPGRTAKSLEAGAVPCAILDDNTFKCWSSRKETESSDNPFPVVNLGTGRTVKSGSGGHDGSHYCVVLDNNTLKCWGNNHEGQLGLGDANDRSSSSQMGDNLPVVNLGTGRTAKYVAAAGMHTCAILDNENVKCWGFNLNGELGLGFGAGGAPGSDSLGDQPNEMGDSLPMVNLGTSRTVKSLVAGYGHKCAVLDNDSVKCWGDNYYGQLGLGDRNNRGDALSEMGDNLLPVELY